MKMFWCFFIVIVFLSLLTGKEAYAKNTLQARINSIPEDGTLHIKKGRYHERIILTKSIHLVGENGTIFNECSSKPVITIKGENVKITGITIESCNRKSSEPIIYISGKNNQIDHVEISSVRTAVKLDNAEYTTLKNLKVTGREQDRGFDLWQSNYNTFTGIQMNHVQDGFYMENSHFNTFIRNTISDSRYGLHVMFSDYITIKNNSSFRNFTGAMIMGTNHSLIVNNKLKDNNQNVNAQGLLLYDVHQSTVKDNAIENNRVGIYMEDSSENVLTKNRINSNFIGAQINNIHLNKLDQNLFIGNVSEMLANRGTNNYIQNNYWDASWRLDTNGDGKSNLPFRADPFFLNLIDETPEYQLFFHAPGMLLLQKMLKGPEKKLITDKNPLMNSGLHTESQAKKDMTSAWVLSFGMIMGSFLMMVKGRKR
jgi:nitrous oxidase accessory protein